MDVRSIRSIDSSAIVLFKTELRLPFTLLVLVEDVVSLIKNENINHSKLTNILNIAEIMEYKFFEDVAKYFGNVFTYGHSLLANPEFVRKHTVCAQSVIDKSSERISIVDEASLCKYFKVPYCFKDYMVDAYFPKAFNSSWSFTDITALDVYPEEIKGCFGYYIETGKFARRNISAFMNTFDDEFFDSLDKIKCFIKYLRKNLSSLCWRFSKITNCVWRTAHP